MDISTQFLTKVIGHQPIEKAAGAAVGADSAYFSAAAFSEGLTAPMTAKQRRNWYETNPWIFAAVDQRCTDVANADWMVGPIDPKKPYSEETARRITDLMTAPNPAGRNDSYASLFHPVTIDTLCLDKGVVQINKYENGEPYQLKALDGARMRIRPDWQKESDGWRYFYMDENGLDGNKMQNDEVIVIQSHPSTYKVDGLAPLDVLNRVLIAEFDTFKSIHILQKNRAPSAILKMPGSSKQAVDQAKALWLDELAGRSGLGFMSLSEQAQLMILGSTNLEEQGAFAFYDMLIRAIAACFRITTLNLNWLQDVNRATAQEQSHMTDEGTVSLLKLYQGYINREIVSCFEDSENIGFFYTQLVTKDEALSIDTVRNMAGRVVNPWSINSMLIASGYDPVRVDDPTEQEFYDKPLVGVANGQMAPPAVAMKLPQYQAGPTGTAVGTARPNNANKPHPVNQIAEGTRPALPDTGLKPAQASYRHQEKGTIAQDQQGAVDTLFEDIDQIFRDAQEAARGSLA